MMHKLHWASEILSTEDGCATARLFGKKIKLQGSVQVYDVATFDALNVQNHRAKLWHTSIEDVFPENDRPRGDDDIHAMESLLYMSHNVPPVMILNMGDYVVLDGAHRISAAYLSLSKIHVQWFVEE